jgi:hypothetical protein
MSTIRYRKKEAVCQKKKKKKEGSCQEDTAEEK